MRVVVVRPEELGDAEIGTWRSMQRATPVLGSPFLSPEFNVAAARFRPNARVAVLTDGQSIAGFFPFEKGRFGVGTPICGWLTSSQGLIHAPDAEWDPRQLLRECGLAAWQFSSLVAGQKPFLRYQDAPVPLPVIDLCGGFAHYQAQLRAKSAKFYRELQRKERKLAHDSGSLRFVADSTDLSILHALMAWKSEQYRQTGMIDRFRFPWIVGLLEALLATPGDHVRGMLCGLYADDQLITGQFGLRSGRLFTGWFTAYNPRFAKYTPGLIQALQLSRALADAGVETIEMGIGPAAYKEILKSRDVSLAEGIVTRLSALAGAHRARWSMARRAARTLVEHPKLYRATRPIRMAWRRAA